MIAQRHTNPLTHGGAQKRVARDRQRSHLDLQADHTTQGGSALKYAPHQHRTGAYMVSALSHHPVRMLTQMGHTHLQQNAHRLALVQPKWFMSAPRLDAD